MGLGHHGIALINMNMICWMHLWYTFICWTHHWLVVSQMGMEIVGSTCWATANTELSKYGYIGIPQIPWHVFFGMLGYDFSGFLRYTFKEFLGVLWILQVRRIGPKQLCFPIISHRSHPNPKNHQKSTQHQKSPATSFGISIFRRRLGFASPAPGGSLQVAGAAAGALPGLWVAGSAAAEAGGW